LLGHVADGDRETEQGTGRFWQNAHNPVRDGDDFSVTEAKTFITGASQDRTWS